MYKVVYKYGDMYTSCVMFDPDWMVVYKVGEKAFPKMADSKLMVFKDLEHAIRFRAYHCSDEAIFECDVENPHVGLVLPQSIIKIQFWHAYSGKQPYKSISPFLLVDAPPGTYFVDSVTLTREVV